MTYEYVVVDIADRYYEENAGSKFNTYEDALAFINKVEAHPLVKHTLKDKLEYLESVKETMPEWKGKKILVISYI